MGHYAAEMNPSAEELRRWPNINVVLRREALTKLIQEVRKVCKKHNHRKLRSLLKEYDEHGGFRDDLTR